MLFKSGKVSKENRNKRSNILFNFLIEGAVIAFSVGLIEGINPLRSHKFAGNFNKLIKKVNRWQELRLKKLIVRNS